ncbi:two-component system response regulator OmpR (plasmid) [Ralstonia solanacearum]|uniref:response regulator n=1 Tax=Ralstonia pseudosolanacearum TaxID=1310165 RepID=UPI00083DE941|nr:response regulator [Ralstonia pseudosolanacearum]AOE91923.1 Transcriptional regulatory protein TcrA [Ralstonia solanacearum]AXW59992.1 two-component system response regulator OmpR [Ralstonia solanacearum]NKA12377.1 DNA-binding response regulator [Ralstonia solanacearum]NKA47127.1 DNA-binding response regulator [Ralstonia solanacearum]UYR03898.1 response regulator [Ralstonia pseudosolanacearum]
MSGTKILVVDDDVELRDLLREYLSQQGFAVSVLHDGDGLAARLERERPALVVLDLMMPKVDGLSALRDLRARNGDVPVILLTARSDEIDRIIGLEIGADDYLGKPFSPRELLARINAVLRRRQAVAPAAPEDRDSFSFGPFRLNFRMRTLFRGEHALSISDTEFALLKLLVTHAMQVLTREHIVELMYGPGSSVSDRGIDVQVWRLRRVLDEDAQRPRYIQTVRGRGYTFVPDERDAHDEVQSPV